jgi:holo-[acyl-carrier protein] synthase
VDLVDTLRFARVIERTPGLVTRVFTSREIELSGGERLRAHSLAARWAAKEAVAKALVHTDGLQWHDCEVLSGTRGEPILALRGTVAGAAARRGIDHWALSLSHDGDMAIAFVVASRIGAGR